MEPTDSALNSNEARILLAGAFTAHIEGLTSFCRDVPYRLLYETMSANEFIACQALGIMPMEWSYGNMRAQRDRKLEAYDPTSSSVVVGHSLGGVHAVECAVSEPKRSTRAIALNPAFDINIPIFRSHVKEHAAKVAGLVDQHSNPDIHVITDVDDLLIPYRSVLTALPNVHRYLFTRQIDDDLDPAIIQIETAYRTRAAKLGRIAAGLPIIGQLSSHLAFGERLATHLSTIWRPEVLRLCHNILTDTDVPDHNLSLAA